MPVSGNILKKFIKFRMIIKVSTIKNWKEPDDFKILRSKPRKIMKYNCNEINELAFHRFKI